MKKLLLATVLVVGSLGYVLFVRSDADADAPQTVGGNAITTAVATGSDAAPVTTSTVAATTASAPPVKTPVVTPATKTGKYTDGTYTGSVADAYYGNIQVQAIVSGGRLSNVKVLQYPNDRSDSIEINRQALPLLISEAISAQSARVDTISGASDTSDAFRQSLSAALAKA